MNRLRYTPLPTPIVTLLRQGGRDSYDCQPERTLSDGGGNPCRHCLDFVPKGAEMLILAHRPFAQMQPYAETGPIFLCADHCAAWAGDGAPPILSQSPDFLLRGYTAQQRIRYGSGKVVPRAQLEDYALSLLGQPDIAFVDVRSARNNCFQLRLTLKDD